MSTSVRDAKHFGNFLFVVLLLRGVHLRRRGEQHPQIDGARFEIVGGDDRVLGGRRDDGDRQRERKPKNDRALHHQPCCLCSGNTSTSRTD